MWFEHHPWMTFWLVGFALFCLANVLIAWANR